MGSCNSKNHNQYKTKTWSRDKKWEKTLRKGDWDQRLATELHTPITQKFKKRRVISNSIDQIWAADLLEMQKFSKWNKGIKYLLIVIDVFSIFGWIEPLKDKRGETVANAFDKIFKSGRKLEMLWKDKGSAFYNRYVKYLLNKSNMKLYSTENEKKSSIVERWNRTIKNKMWKMLSENAVYHDKIDKLVSDYNFKEHSSIKITPS